MQLAFARAPLVLFTTLVVVGDAMLEQMVEGSRNLVRRSHDGLLGPSPTAHAAVERAKRRLWTTSYGLGGHPKGLPGTVCGLERLAPQDLAARNVVVRSQTQPGTEVFRAGEGGQVSAGLADNG